MTNLINKFKSALSTAVLLAAGVVMIGLGFAFVGTIALIGLAAVGVAVIASLFATQDENAAPETEVTA